MLSKIVEKDVNSWLAMEDLLAHKMEDIPGYRDLWYSRYYDLWESRVPVAPKKESSNTFESFKAGVYIGVWALYLLHATGYDKVIMDEAERQFELMRIRVRKFIRKHNFA